MANGRSPLVQAILQRQAQRRQRPIHSGGQLLAQLGAQALERGTLNREAEAREAERRAANEEIARAIATATRGVPSFQNPDAPEQQLVPPVQGGTQDALIAALSGLQSPGTEGLQSQLGSLAIQQAFQRPQQQTTTLTTNEKTALGIDPRAIVQRSPDGELNIIQSPDDAAATFETVTDTEGNVIGQRNTRTGKVESNPIGKAQQDIQKQEKEDTRIAEAKVGAIQNIDDSISVVDRLLSSENLSSGFGLSGITGAIPGTSAADIQAQVNTLKARLGFDQLQKMRDASPTGGALGQVSERELGFLQSTVQSLDFGQSDEQALENIKLIRQSLARWRNALDPLPAGMTDNGDGTFTLPDGRIVERE